MPALLVSDKTAAILKDVAQQGGSHAAIKELQSELDSPPEPQQKGATFPRGTIVNHQRLVQLAKWAALADVPRHLQTDLDLASLLKGAQVAMPIKVEPVRSPDLVETLRRIQLAKDEEEYEKMIHSSSPQARGKGIAFGFRTTAEKQSPWGTKATRSEAEEWEEVKRQLGAIVNVGLSVAAVVTATWWAGGSAGPIWKTLVALPLSILVAVAEVVLYARHWDNVRKREEKRKTSHR